VGHRASLLMTHQLLNPRPVQASTPYAANISAIQRIYTHRAPLPDPLQRLRALDIYCDAGPRPMTSIPGWSGSQRCRCIRRNAREELSLPPTHRILSKGHPETRARPMLALKTGLFHRHRHSDVPQRPYQLSQRSEVSPWGLLEGAVAVLLRDLELGFEAPFSLTPLPPGVFGPARSMPDGALDRRTASTCPGGGVRWTNEFCSILSSDAVYPICGCGSAWLGSRTDSFRALSASARAGARTHTGSRVAMGMRAVRNRGHLRRMFGRIT